MHYIAVDDDPQFNYINWVQRVTSNHAWDSDDHGDSEDTLDVKRDAPRPFYFPDYDYRPNFFDRSYRGDFDQPHFWNAELFLTKDYSSGTVEIYNGIAWGWKNVRLPKLDDNPSCPPGRKQVGKDCLPPLAWTEYCVNSDLDDNYPIYSSTGLGQIGYGCEWRPIYDNNAAQASRMSLIETETKEAASVSEPGTMAAVLAVGLWSGVSWRKRRQQAKSASSGM
jgi:hypothetical protein